MGYRIFLSVGGQATDQQFRYVEAFKSFMREYDMEPVTAKAGLASPFDNINEKMRDSDGVIVIAFERYYASQLIENRHADRPDRQETEHHNVRLPTTWNQVEAAFAWAWSLPLLVVCESGLKEDALLERGAKWHVHRVDMSNTNFDALRQAMQDLSATMARSQRPLVSTWRRASDAGRVGLLGTFIGTMIAIGTAAFTLGKFLNG